MGYRMITFIIIIYVHSASERRYRKRRTRICTVSNGIHATLIVMVFSLSLQHRLHVLFHFYHCFHKIVAEDFFHAFMLSATMVFYVVEEKRVDQIFL